MRSASYRVSPEWRRVTLRHRVTGFVLALVFEALVVIALLTLAPSFTSPPENTSKPLTFQLLPSSQVAPKPPPKGRTAANTRQPNRQTAVRPPVLPPTKLPAPLSLAMSKEDFAATDIASLPSHGGEGKDSGSSYGPGEGPGGARLFNAEWYVEPTHGELAYYLPNGAPAGSWAMIACRTIEKYHVENCISLGESPPGSGLAKALRLAAWQFRVRPPRIGGRALIGAWVRIRFDFTVNGDKLSG